MSYDFQGVERGKTKEIKENNVHFHTGEHTYTPFF